MKKTYVNDKKPYVLQRLNGQCSDILIENFWIELTGKNPFKNKVLTLDEQANLESQYNVLKEPLKCKSSLKKLKQLMVKSLAEGHMLQFAFVHPHDFHHWALITHYYPRFDSFRVINAQLLTNETPVEYVKFEELTRMAMQEEDSTFEYHFVNKRERTNILAKFTIMETKVLIPVHPVFRSLSKPLQSNHFIVEHNY